MLLWGGLMMLAFVAFVRAMVWLIATRTGPHVSRQGRPDIIEEESGGEIEAHYGEGMVTTFTVT
jgi:hypothetical protein